MAKGPTDDLGVRPRTPGEMLWRLSGSLNQLLATGIARRTGDDLFELVIDEDEAAQGGMVRISMWVRVICQACADGAAACSICDATRAVDELYSAWLAVPPGVASDTVLLPTVLLPGMARPVRFQMHVLDGE
jgi:hypothetical protein